MSKNNILRPEFGKPIQEKTILEQIAETEAQKQKAWREVARLRAAGNMKAAIQKGFEAFALEEKVADLRTKLPPQSEEK